MKKWLNKILTFSLACSLAATPTVTSLAEGVNGGGSGNSQTGSTIEYVSNFHAFQINNGIQCSIVSRETGELVSNIITMNSYLPTRIDECPDPLVEKYWNQFAGRTGAFNTKKSHIMFLNGSKTDSWFVRNLAKIGDASGNRGVLYLNHATDNIEQGKMYTYSDIEYALKTKLDSIYSESKYAEAYNKAGGSPIDPDGGFYAPTGASKDFLGPVCLIDGNNTATGDNFKTQMNTELPDGALVLQYFLNLKISKADGLGNIVGDPEPLFYFTVPEMQQRYEELSKQEGVNPVIEVMKEFGLKAEFEDIAWMVNEVDCPTAPAGYNRSGLTGENFWNTPYIYYGSPSLVSYQTARDFVTYIQNPLAYARALTPEMKDFLAKAKQEIGSYSANEIDANIWINKAISWFKTNGVGQTWDWSLAYQAFSIERPEPQMGLQTFEGLGIDRHTVNTMGLGLAYWFEHMKDLGYGVMLFSPEKEPEGTSTFDEDNFASTSDRPYSPGPSEDKTYEGGKEQQNKIVKFYTRKNGDTYIPVDNFTREDTVSPVVLENEEIYVVEDWFTSTEFRKPTSSSDSYTDWKNGVLNKDTGVAIDKPVNLNPGETIYVKLVKQPSVIKIFTTGGNVDKVVMDNDPDFESGKLVITPNEGDYSYKENKQTPEEKEDNITSWEELPGTPNTSQEVVVDDTTNTIYIHYNREVEAGGLLVLHEDEISHNFELANVTGERYTTIRDYVSVSAPRCSYTWEEYCGNDDCSGHTRHCRATMGEDDPGDV